MASLAKRPNGKFEVRYIDPATGKHRSKSFVAKKSAQAYKRDVEIEIESGNHIAATQKLTVKQVCKDFLKFNDERLADGRIGQSRHKVIRTIVTNSFIPLLGNKVMDELKPHDLERFYADMVQGGISPRGARGRVSHFTYMEEFAQRRGYSNSSASLAARKQLRGIESTPIRTLTVDQVKHLLATISVRRKGQSYHWWRLTRCAVSLAAICGLRIGEIFALQRDAVDFENKIIRVRNNITLWGKMKAPKTSAGKRDVPLPDDIAELIKEWHTHHFASNEHDLIFTSGEGTWLRHANFRDQAWIPALKAAGLYVEGDIVHFHSLRHFAASWMIAGQIALPDVAALLGHKKFDVTLQVYAHSIIGGGSDRHDKFNATSKLMTSQAA